MTLWTAGVFSTTTMWSPSGPPKPSSAIAAVPSASSRCLYPGSIQARATTFAPFSGPISDSYRRVISSMNPSGTSPRSVSSASSAATRRSTGDSGAG